MARITRIAKIKRRISKKSKAPCEVCTTKKISTKSGLYALKSGDTHLRQYLPSGNELRQNPNASEKVILEGLKPRMIFFYFATNSKDFTQPMQHFKDAYDNILTK